MVNITLSSHRKLSMVFKSTYLHSTLIHSKGQNQVDAHLGCVYLVNGDIYGMLTIISSGVDTCKL